MTNDEMEDIIKNHPLPWKVNKQAFQEHPNIEDANGSFVISSLWYDVGLLEFLVNVVNTRSEVVGNVVWQEID